MSEARADRWLAAVPWIGLAIFCVNMGLAWSMASSASEYIRQPLLGPNGDSSIVLAQMKDAGLGQAMMYRRIIEGTVHMKAIANRQTIMVVGMSAGFGFLALGFGLVIMAVKGSFALSGALPNKTGELMLRSSSPGVLCFVLGAIIICVALLQQTQLEFGSMRLESTQSQPGAAQANDSPTEPIAVPERFSFDEAATRGGNP